MNPLSHPLLTALGVLALVGLALLQKEEDEPKVARNQGTGHFDDEEYDGFAIGV